MQLRIITTVFLISGVLLAIWSLGHWGGIAVLVFLSSLALWETSILGLAATPSSHSKSALSPQLDSAASRRMRLAELVMGVAIILAAHQGGSLTFALLLAVLLGLIAIVPPSGCLSGQREVRGIALRALYLPWMLQFYVLALGTFGTLWAPLWLVAVAKSNDIGALLGGRRFGKTLMWPAISPRKTWEGAICGILAGAIVGLALAASPTFREATGLTLVEALEIALLLGPVAILSDLSASWLKRRAHCKDSGNSIPGIGGGLDVVDSMIFVGPIGYLLIVHLGQP